MGATALGSTALGATALGATALGAGGSTILEESKSLAAAPWFQRGNKAFSEPLLLYLISFDRLPPPLSDDCVDKVKRT